MTDQERASADVSWRIDAQCVCRHRAFLMQEVCILNHGAFWRGYKGKGIRSLVAADITNRGYFGVRSTARWDTGKVRDASWYETEVELIPRYHSGHTADRRSQGEGPDNRQRTPPPRRCALASHLDAPVGPLARPNRSFITQIVWQ